MRTKNIIRKVGLMISTVLLILLGSQIISSINIESINVLPSINATTTENLECYFSITGNESFNVSWYKNYVLFNSTNETNSPYTLSYVKTTEDDIWNCTVMAFNATNGTTKDSNIVTIVNTIPTIPYVANSSGTDIGDYEELIEGIEYNFTLVTYDPDNDITFYMIPEGSYCDIDSSSGIISCNATNETNIATRDQFKFFVNDEEKDLGSTVNFNVSPVNDWPYFTNSFNNKTINETQTLYYPINVSDPENPDGPFNLSVSSTYGDSRLKNYTTDYHNFVIRFTGDRPSNFSDVDVVNVTVTACDTINSSMCIADSFFLEVITINHDPVFDGLENATGNQTELFTMYVNATDIDTDDLLNFSIASPECGQDIWTLTDLKNNYDNASALINVTLNNSHILCRNITVYVSDSKTTFSQNLYLNLSNVNDYPVLSNISHNNTNTNSNFDIRNLTAYTQVEFVYQINGSDPDFEVDADETLTYTDNSSLCNGDCPTLTMDTSNGLIRFMPNSSLTSNYYYTITLTDNDGVSVSTLFNITILNNSLPYFNETPTNQTAYEDTLFSYKLNATDPESMFDEFSDNTTLFDISEQGLISFNHNCSYVGNYTVTVFINDTFSATNQSTFSIEILPTNDTPIINVLDNITIFEESIFEFDLSIDTVDEDVTVCNQGDNLTFNSEFIGKPEFFNITSAGYLYLNPNSSHDDSYLINISVTDSTGRNDWFFWNVTVINRSESPIIHNITPHGTPINLTWALTEDYPTNLTNINTTEEITILFDHNTTDIDSTELFFNWTVNGEVITYNKSYTRYFNYNSNGRYNITLVVSDNITGMLAHEVNFTWNLTIANNNRPPLLNNSLWDINLSSTWDSWTYLDGSDDEPRFNDPDNDVLSFNHTPVTVVDITIIGDKITFEPIAIGQEQVIFSAYDGQYYNYSNNVTINVTQIPNETQESVTVVLASSSSSSSTSEVLVPYSILQEVEVDKEIFLDIINPEPVVIYSNNTLRQTISVVNTGNKTLKGITLGAKTNSTTADISFSNNYIPVLSVGESAKTDLIIVDYKLYNNYQIIIEANVTDPYYKDKAVIYINALEKSRGNQSVTNTKITFARDLLNSNPECLELNEYLKKALNQIELNNYDEASRITDSVIQGCKYLVSQSKLDDQRPANLILNMSKVPYLIPSLVLFTLLIGVAVIATIKAKKVNEELERESS